MTARRAAVAALVGLLLAVLPGCRSGAVDAGSAGAVASATSTTARRRAATTTSGRPRRSTSTASTSTTPGDRASGLPTVLEADLPVEARRTLARIDAGGPFPHRRDGVTFENRERRLPPRERGWYREYTVPTPGEDDRGPRRIVAGEAGERYWTADHYASFAEVVRG